MPYCYSESLSRRENQLLIAQAADVALDRAIIVLWLIPLVVFNVVECFRRWMIGGTSHDVSVATSNCALHGELSFAICTKRTVNGTEPTILLTFSCNPGRRDTASA